MTPGQRVEIGIGLTRLAWAMLDVPDPAHGDRKWARWLEEHDDGLRRLFEALERDREESG